MVISMDHEIFKKAFLGKKKSGRVWSGLVGSGRAGRWRCLVGRYLWVEGEAGLDKVITA